MKLLAKRLDGDFISVIAQHNDTLENVLDRNGFRKNRGTRLQAVSNGKVLSIYCTVEYLGLQENQKIFVLEKRIEQNIFPLKLQISLREREEKAQNQILLEKCRLADLGFSGWECDPSYGQLLQEIYEDEKEIEEYEEEVNEYAQVTVIAKTQAISDQPLPCVYIMPQSYK